MTRDGARAALAGRPRVRLVLVMRHIPEGPVGVLQGSTMAESADGLRAAAHRLVDRMLDRLEGRLPEDAT